MSSSPSDLAKLPKWPFLLTDAVLVAAAFSIAWHRPVALTGVPLVSVVVCVVLAAILCVIPFLVDYAQSEHEALSEQQRALEALARSTAATAEQVSIAAQALSRLVEQSQSTLSLTERAVGKLQERVTDLQQQLTSERDEEVEALERELAALRETETARLESSAERIHRTGTELAKVEASAAKHAAAAHEALSKLGSMGPAMAQQISQQAEASSAMVVRSIAQAQSEASAALESEQRRLAETLSKSAAGEVAALERRIDALAIVLKEHVAALTLATENLSEAVESAEMRKPAESPGEGLRSRRSRSTSTGRDEPSAAASAEEGTPVMDQPAPPSFDPAPLLLVPDERSETPADGAATKEVSVPATPAESSAAVIVPFPAPEPEVSAGEPGAAGEKVAPAEPQGKQASSEDTEFDQSAPEERVPVMSVSADGATRLIVTAYIGIGNRLYLRGDGPGLSWDHGLPLQFVSIGKWRWESAEASTSVRVKLLKNDQVECGSLGEIVLQPGHQAEVTANF